MKALLTVISSLIISTLAFAHGDDHGVSNAKAAELAAHRIDRLVALGKIDAAFSKRLETIQVAVVSEGPAHFKVRLSQTQPASGNPVQVDITLDGKGKPLAHQVVNGGSSGPDRGWSGKDSVTLSENALHYVIDNAKDPKYAPFNDGLKSFVLSKGTYKGQTVARGQILSSLSSGKLNVYLKLDGSFIAAEVEQ